MTTKKDAPKNKYRLEKNKMFKPRGWKQLCQSIFMLAGLRLYISINQNYLRSWFNVCTSALCCCCNPCLTLFILQKLANNFTTTALGSTHVIYTTFSLTKHGVSQPAVYGVLICKIFQQLILIIILIIILIMSEPPRALLQRQILSRIRFMTYRPLLYYYHYYQCTSYYISQDIVEGNWKFLKTIACKNIVDMNHIVELKD